MATPTFYLYQHTRPDKDQVFYVGVGKEGTKRAWETRKRNKYWKSVVELNGGVFDVKILMSGLTEEQAVSEETKLIESLGRKIYSEGTLVNFQPGGKNRTGYVMTDDAKKALSERMINNTYASNVIWTDERKQRMSIITKGRKNNLGKKWSEQTKTKMSNAHKGNSATKGYIRITNGSENRLIQSDTIVPEGWYRGRTISGK